MFLPCEKFFGQRGFLKYCLISSGFQYRTAYSVQIAEIVKFFLHFDHISLFYYIILSLAIKTFHFVFLYNWFWTNSFGHIFLFIKKQWIKRSLQCLCLMIKKLESIQLKSSILKRFICKPFFFLHDWTILFAICKQMEI